MAKASALTTSMRTTLLVGVLSFCARNYLQGYFFPHGLPAAIPLDERLGFAEIDSSNDILQARHGKLTKIVERLEEGQEPLLIGPETVIIHPVTNVIYGIARGAKLVRLDDLQPSPNDPHTVTAKVTVAADLGLGTPLSGRFTNDGQTLYMVDPILGLFRIPNFQDDPNNKQSKIELVASKVWDNNQLTPMLYLDDIAIGPKTGKIYFSDATDIAPDRLVQKNDWDVLYASKTECVRGKPSGRLLEYDPATDEVKVLARDLWFANGVSVDEEESYVVISQTFAMRLSKYHLTGPKQGTLETIVDSHQLTGYTDGVDCSWETSGPSASKCYLAVPTPIVPAIKHLQVIPHPIDQILRGMLLMLPKWLAPDPVDYGCVVEVDMKTGETRMLQDPDATDTKFITGVRVVENKLYLGSIHTNVIAIYDLS